MSKRAAFAKVSVPRLFGIVERARLFMQLDARRGCPLIWIDGPPGAGKTALVAGYVEARRLPVLWYQVDASDSDPASFFHWLEEACVAQFGTRGPALPRFSLDHLTALPDFARRFFRQFFARLPAGAVIVFDNYHEVPQDAALQTLLLTATSQVTRESSVFCLSRLAPTPEFSQLTARGLLTRLPWQSLAVTHDETRAILGVRELRDEWLVNAIHQQSEGWVAGITLMLERLGHVGAHEHALSPETRGSVFEYFATLIFSQSSEAVRQILMSVSMLPYVSPRMARELSGQHDADKVLEDFYRRQLFVDKREHDGTAYHFHALFSEFLRTSLLEKLSACEVSALNARAALLLEADDDPDSAIKLWVLARDWDNVVRLVMLHAQAMLRTGRGGTLRRWIELLPAESLRTRPRVLYWFALVQGQTSSEAALILLRRALPLFDRAQDKMDCLAAMLSMGFVGFLALDEMEKWLDQLLTLLEKQDSTHTQESELSVWGVLCSALFWIKPWHPWTSHAARRVEELLGAGTDANILVNAASSALATCTFTGEFELADRIIGQTRHLPDGVQVSPTAAVWWLTHAGFLRFFEARYDESLAYMERAAAVAELNSLRPLAIMAGLHQCAVEFRCKGWEVAGKTLAWAQRELSGNVAMEAGMFYLLKGRQRFSQGQTEVAADFALQGYDAGRRTGSQYQEMLFGMLAAEMLIAAHRIAEARPLLARSRAMLENSPVFDCWQAALHWVEAYLSLQEEGAAHALVALERALALAQAGKRRHYLRHFECALPPLLNLALREGILVPLAQEIILLFRLEVPDGASDRWPRPVRILTLGGFSVQFNGEPLRFSRKTPKKTLGLLKALIAYGGREVPERLLCDALWADEEGDAAHEALSITTFRLRKLLGVNEALIKQGSKLTLNRSVCWVDAWDFDDLATRNSDSRIGDFLEYYGGEFLPEDSGEAWSVSTRERLRGKFIHLLATHGGVLEREVQFDKALSLYFRGIDADPVVESFHQGLMRCYQGLGRHSEALSAFRRLRQTLSAVLGLAPSAESCRLFELSLSAGGNDGSPTDEATVLAPPHRKCV